MNRELCILFYVKDTCSDFDKVCADPSDCKPWELMADSQGLRFTKWNAAVLGKPQPDVALIESLSDQAEAWKAAQVQAAKPAELKACENLFLLLCERLTGKREKVGFDTLRAIIEAMLQTDPQTAMVLSLKLLSIDAEGKRFDSKWWDSAVFHNE